MHLCGLGGWRGGISDRAPPGDFCILGPAQLEAAITAWWLITLPDIRSVDRGGSEPVSRGQPEVLSLNNPPVIAGHRESFNGQRLRACSGAGLCGGDGKGRRPLMTEEVTVADNPSLDPSQEARRKEERRKEEKASP